MKKNKIMMLGAAALVSSALFSQGAFAKVDEDKDAYVAPPSMFHLPAHPSSNAQLPAAKAPAVSAPVEKDSDKF